MECYCYLRHVQDLLADGKIIVKDDSEALTPQRKNHIPSSRWHGKIVRKRPRSPRTHSEAGTTCGERRSQWRTSGRTGRSSTDKIKR